MTIAEMAEWGKRTLGNKAIPALVVITAAGSFGLGMVAQKNGEGQPKSLKPWVETRSGSATTSPSGLVLPVSAAAAAAVTNLKHTSSVHTQVPAAPMPAGLPESSAGAFVGARSGHTYYLLSCGMVKHIKDGNKVYFDSRVDAEKKGYEPAKNCKGM